ncbi:MAG: cation transporter [Myxococcales bacterium]|nr:cation transporter [Myxococcales bacterium]
MPTHDLSRYGWLSVGAAVLTLGLKSGAWLATGSVGLMSDALESLVNLAAGLLAVYSLRLAAQPPDEGHPLGHGKVEYFTSGIEGALILFAAGGILLSALPRLLHPLPVSKLDLGLVLSMAATAINALVGLLLIRVGRRHESVALEADGQHLMTDVWTSVGVLAGLVLVRFSGWLIVDPLIACAVAVHIIAIGLGLVRRSIGGLMDSALPTEERSTIEQVLADFRRRGLDFHALRTHMAGRRRFVSLHVLVPPDITVQAGHALAEEVERAIRDRLPRSVVFTHVEPLGSPESNADIPLDRS